MGWQRRLYAKQEPSGSFRIWTTAGGLFLLGVGAGLLLSGGRMVNGDMTDVALGSVLLVLSVPLFFAGIGIILLAWMRWSNPGISD